MERNSRVVTGLDVKKFRSAVCSTGDIPTLVNSSGVSESPVYLQKCHDFAAGFPRVGGVQEKIRFSPRADEESKI